MADLTCWCFSESLFSLINIFILVLQPADLSAVNRLMGMKNRPTTGSRKHVEPRWSTDPKCSRYNRRLFFFFFLRFDQLGLFVGEQMQQSWRLKEILNPNSSAGIYNIQITSQQINCEMRLLLKCFLGEEKRRVSDFKNRKLEIDYEKHSSFCVFCLPQSLPVTSTAAERPASKPKKKKVGLFRWSRAVGRTHNYEFRKSAVL